MQQWQGDETRLGQLCQLFSLASSPDNAVQQQVMQTLNQFSEMPDFNMYLVTVFAKMPSQEEVVRQRAGLLLKTNISKSAPPQMEMAQYIQENTMLAVRDPNRTIRHTAGTVLTQIVQKIGVAPCLPTLDRLAEWLGDSDPNTVEGTFNALNKICEDGVATLKAFWEAPAEFTQPFVDWCTAKLLPRLFAYAAPSAPLFVRQNALECLNHFALSWLFNDMDGRYPTLGPFGEQYMLALGNLATDTDTTVLKDVCKGFVAIVENNWSCLTPQFCQVVLQYMLKASSHAEYAVRLEALEVWTPCTNHPALLQLVKPMLQELVPCLMTNMVYSPADYMAMEQSIVEDDNAEVPDRQEDMPPRFHKEQDAVEEGEEGGGGGAWGTEWTARKAAASALDHLANAFQREILDIVLPLIQRKLEDQNWEVQESGVLALGAIAYGCMEHLVQFLPQVMELLLNNTKAQKPLLRSISCWCVSRFSHWICHEQNPNRDAVLKAVLAALLERVLDKNKRVQEAACSAFATLEEEARSLMVPYLNEIVQTLVRAFQMYQAKNLLILYDAVGTLANSVGRDLNQPQYVEALLVPLLKRFEEVADNDRSIIALFECLSALTRALGPSMAPIATRLVQRAGRLVSDGARQAVLWRQDPNNVERPDREVMSASIDLLAAIVEGFQERVGEVLQQQNFLQILPEVLKDTALQVKQSAFALMGDSAKNCIDHLAQFLPELLPLCAQALSQNSSANVSNNASWAIGEVCVKVGPEFMQQYLETLLPALVGVLLQPKGQRLLAQNICITLGRLGKVCGHLMGPAFPQFAKPWCVVMKTARLDGEKLGAFEGLVNLIKANPQACMQCVPELAGAICSMCPAPTALEPQFREILTGYKQQLGGSWPEAYAQFPPDVQQRLTSMYGLSA